MTRTRALLLVAALATIVAVGWSARPHEPTTEERVDRITAELRCVVCQGLSVRDSPSESARQMRDIVAQRVSEGRSDDQIRDEFRASYGDWVVLSPPVASWTGLVWLVPLAALAAGLAVAWRRLATPAPPPPAPSATELAALRERVAREETADA